MGTDCSMITERNCNGRWETIGVMQLPRDYELFAEIQAEYVRGYPYDVDTLTKDILDGVEDWGEGHMPYKMFRELLKKHDMMDLDVIKKKYRASSRVIFRFDN